MTDLKSVITTDASDPRLTRGSNEVPTPQAEAYLVLSGEELSKGFIRPFRTSYKHKTCGGVTTMGDTLSATYARDPHFYGSTYCCICSKHRPVAEFVWSADNSVVGS